MKFPIKTYSFSMFSYGFYSYYKSDKYQIDRFYVDKFAHSTIQGSIYLIPPVGLYHLARDIEKLLTNK